MSQDIFDQLETDTREALESVIYEFTSEIGLKFRNDFLLSLPVPDASLCWHNGKLQAVVSFQATRDGFGDDLVKHVVDLAYDDVDLVVWNTEGSFLSAEEPKDCAAYLRKLADAIESR